MESPRAAEEKALFADFIFSSSPAENIYLIPAKTIKSSVINPIRERRFSVTVIIASAKVEISLSTGLQKMPRLGPQVAWATKGAVFITRICAKSK